MKNILLLIRPKQWLKNVFVLVPIFFGGSLLNARDAWSGFVAFMAFSFVASPSATAPWPREPSA